MFACRAQRGDFCVVHVYQRKVGFLNYTEDIHHRNIQFGESFGGRCARPLVGADGLRLADRFRGRLLRFADRPRHERWQLGGLGLGGLAIGRNGRQASELIPERYVECSGLGVFGPHHGDRHAMTVADEMRAGADLVGDLGDGQY